MKGHVLAKRLKNLREEKGYLQKFVADKIGVRSNTLSGYENGTRTPDPDIIIVLANLYGVTTDYLLGKSDSRQPTIELQDDLIDDELQDFIDSVKVWYKNEPESKEEKLKMAKKMFEVFEEDK